MIDLQNFNKIQQNLEVATSSTFVLNIENCWKSYTLHFHFEIYSVVPSYVSVFWQQSNCGRGLTSKM